MDRLQFADRLEARFGLSFRDGFAHRISLNHANLVAHLILNAQLLSIWPLNVNAAGSIRDSDCSRCQHRLAEAVHRADVSRRRAVLNRTAYLGNEDVELP